MVRNSLITLPALRHARQVFPSRWRTYVLSGGLLLLLTGILAFATLQPFQVLPRIGLGPGFALIDQDGERLTSEDLRGQLVLYNFTDSGCVTPCVQTSQVMRDLQVRLPQIATQGLPVTLVTIAFDDTPAQLHHYAAALGADLTTWHFLTGEPAHLKQVIGGGFGIYYAVQANGTVAHEPTFVLVDGNGIIRARYRTATPDLAVIERDIELISREVRESHGAMRLAYEAAHLFLCYPQ